MTKVKKTSCCCGATKDTPCVCMIQGNECSMTEPKCACYSLIDKQKEVKKSFDVGWSLVKK